MEDKNEGLGFENFMSILSPEARECVEDFEEYISELTDFLDLRHICRVLDEAPEKDVDRLETLVAKDLINAGFSGLTFEDSQELNGEGWDFLITFMEVNIVRVREDEYREAVYGGGVTLCV